MIERRPYHQLGAADYGWLDTKYHFSFSNYFNRNRMNWGNLRVWNDDIIAPQSGFDPHPHKEMEIITYVRSGAISHRDSMGNEGRTEAGDVQVMSAGSGVYHAEYNLEDERTTLFQIWILPTMESAKGEPSWGMRLFPKAERAGRFSVLASGIDGDDALPIRTNARVVGATLKAGDTAEYRFADGSRYGYLVPAEGDVEINGIRIEKGDGAAIHGETLISVTALSDAEIVMVDTE
ncbi:pirin family protein [Neisseria animalis]|uniref:Pirin family protein n=1 Tax=Neisseria animalis TaxID=492 RepID=A0A5P3MT87_NEIAN|nr:pirin family protein [Neisseria animalis]QEY24836.1 pirin family protein [Neisseria animalis]ROW31565.1 pirin family protein [Neisseria animalis]VEE07966.1 Quercetin 2,3-dioxygenase [Neisseria animalis]